MEKPNILTRELGAYSIVVTYFRLLQGHTVSTELDGDFIRYPVPNMVSEYLKQPFEDQALRIKSILAQMTQEEAMAESFNIYMTSLILDRFRFRMLIPTWNLTKRDTSGIFQ